MEIELRPLSLGELLDRTFALYRARFPMFLGIAAVAAACELLINAAQSTTVHLLLRAGHRSPLQAAFNGFVTLPAAALLLVCYAVVFSAITRAVAALYLRQEAGTAKAYREIAAHWFRYVRLGVAVIFMAWWPLVVLFVLLLIPIVMLRHAGGAASHLGTAIFIGAIALLFVACIPVAIWLLLRYSLAQAACVIENLNVRDSLRRSVVLSKGLRWRIFLLLALVFLFRIIMAALLLSPTFSLLARSHGHVPLWATCYTLLIAFLVSCITVPVYGIGLTLFYFDARIRKEGFDIEWMLNRMGSQSGTEPLGESSPGLIPG